MFAQGELSNCKTLSTLQLFRYDSVNPINSYLLLLLSKYSTGSPQVTSQSRDYPKTKVLPQWPRLK